jgi:hypothetical protein
MRLLSEEIAIGLPIAAFKKDDLAPIAALGKVVRASGHDDAGCTGHAPSLHGGRLRRKERYAAGAENGVSLWRETHVGRQSKRFMYAVPEFLALRDPAPDLPMRSRALEFAHEQLEKAHDHFRADFEKAAGASGWRRRPSPSTREPALAVGFFAPACAPHSESAPGLVIDFG